MNPTSPTPERRALRKPDLEARGITYTDQHLHRLENAGHFPKRFKLSVMGGKFGAVAWDSLEIEQYLAERRASRAAATETKAVSAAAEEQA